MAPTLFDSGAKPGDLIEIFRGTYKHWALYIGGDEVVHLTTHEAGDSGCLNNLKVLVECDKAVVRRQEIWEVAGGDRFIINNLLDKKHKPREPEVIVRDACKLVGQELPYDTISRNCEHFVTELRYGKPKSQQVEDAAVIGGAFAVAAAGIGIIALGATLFSHLLKDDDDDDDKKKRRRRRRN